MKKILLMIFLSVSIIFSQQESLTGLLKVDSKISFDNSFKQELKTGDNSLNKKSPLLGAVLSFAVPGVGQFYSKSYIKSAIFIAIEATAITVGLIYDKKGDDQTDYFQRFANEHWNVKRYALWTITNATKINPQVNPNDFRIFNSDGSVNWKELNRLENAIGGYYSHHLAPFGDQQYYEMIGKYPQFNVGWDDFGDEHTPFNYGDPLTPNFLYYSHERGKANDFYNIAYKAVLIIITNHIISAVDAAWSTSRYNRKLQMSAQLKKDEIGFRTIYYPQLNLQYTF
ncbi:MAG: hypothetical protein QHH13_01095 [Melioribacter sp.]|uniref:hypothetical protein n=1 Tax=Rosettibacter primus TaxID=3111523 RepID=UPI00247B616F|nr:hypothetical protein [Melioribacter sp.]